MSKILVKDVVEALLKMPQDMEVLQPFEDIGLMEKRHLPRVELQKEDECFGETCFKSYYEYRDDKSTFKKYCII
jgi:hypothetical protein